jgi:hypothetical protein
MGGPVGLRKGARLRAGAPGFAESVGRSREVCLEPRSRVPYRRKSIDQKDAILDRLREFLRLNYVTAAEVPRRIGVRDMTVYSWLQGESRPSKPDRITAFLNSIPAESGSGITPNGYQYREYKNWRGVSKPRRCPFCKQVKGKVRRLKAAIKAFVLLVER